jgi:hypothetical protein
MTYRLWWTVGYTCTSEREFLAAKHRLLPATYEMLDDALRRASQVGRAGGVAWLIEGDDKTRLERGLIEKTLKKRRRPLPTGRPTGAAPTSAATIRTVTGRTVTGRAVTGRGMTGAR